MSNKLSILWSGLAFMLLSGCASSPEPRQYVFSPREGWRSVAVRDMGESAYVIRFAQIELPAYIDRPHIVTRINDHEIKVAQMHRWGMPLNTTMLEIVGAALARSLPDAYIDVQPVRHREAMGYTVEINVVRLDGPLGGKVELIAQWKLIKISASREVIAQRLGHHVIEAANASHEAYVEAVRQVVDELGLDIAKVVQAHRATAPSP